MRWFWQKRKNKIGPRTIRGTDFLSNLKKDDKVQLYFTAASSFGKWPHACTVNANMPTIKTIHVSFYMIKDGEDCEKHQSLNYDDVADSVLDLNQRADGNRIAYNRANIK